MHYKGGKHKIAPLIVSSIATDLRLRGIEPVGLPWWDPFCGGLSCAVAMAKLCGPGCGAVSAANAALIALYDAVRAGTWDPPLTATEDDWREARTLPDTDPRKAFFGIGASYGAMWFSAPATARNRRWNKQQNYWCDDNPVGASRSALLRDLPLLRGATLQPFDFLKLGGVLSPRVGDGRAPLLVYCDPPYAGVTGYTATGPFDHELFWLLVRSLARRPDIQTGGGVYVSEYSIPEWVDHELIWSRPSGTMIGRKGSGLDKRARNVDSSGRTENLYRILPDSVRDSRLILP